MTHSRPRDAFARPEHVHGGFDADAIAANHTKTEHISTRQLTPPEIARAFSRPMSSSDPSFEEVGGLQRRKETAAPETDEPPYDPWSDPQSRAQTGQPALPPEPVEEPKAAELLPKVSFREVMFGRGIGWHHVAGVAIVTLLVGGLGGFVGGWFGHEAKLTSSRVELGTAPQPETDLTAVGKVTEKVQPAVVSISVTSPKGSGVGSGFVIDGSGYILTNNHVVSGAADAESAKISVQFAPHENDSPKEVPAQIVGRDPMTDLAVIKVSDVTGLTVSALGDSENVKVGDQVLALGSPLGLKRTVTTGIVSAVNRPVRLSGEGTDTDGAADAIQTDASINPGNSGGPLVDMSGAVIGINTSIFSTTGGSQGLGFAIPINTAKGIAEQIIAGHTPVHADIGVTSRPASNGSTSGAEIATVAEDSPAQKAGLKEGDVVTKVGNRSISGPEELLVAIWESEADKSTTLTAIRDGREINVDVTPAQS